MPEEQQSQITKILSYCVKFVAPLVLCLLAVFGFLDKRSQDRQAKLNKRFDEIKQDIASIKNGDVPSIDRRLLKVEIMVELMNKDLATNESRLLRINRVLADTSRHNP